MADLDVCGGWSKYGIICGMEKLATDIYTFSELVKNGFTYIDKTDRLWPLVNLSIGKQFFIARPRRFGKSLTLIGLAFSKEKRTIVDAAVERVRELSGIRKS